MNPLYSKTHQLHSEYPGLLFSKLLLMKANAPAKETGLQMTKLGLHLWSFGKWLLCLKFLISFHVKFYFLIVDI